MRDNKKFTAGCSAVKSFSRRRHRTQDPLVAEEIRRKIRQDVPCFQKMPEIFLITGNDS